MKVDHGTKNDRPTEIYRDIMRGIEFMEKYIVDPDIFNPESTNFKSFLIQSFCFLYPDFHYLSFLRKEEEDLEIIKVASILQILPGNTKEIIKLFDGLTKDDIHRFWLKFFTLFKKQKDFSTSSLFNTSCENKINFFNDMASTQNYLRYEFPVVNMKKNKHININEEIDNWKVELVNSVVSGDDLASFNHNEEPATNIDVAKLTIDLKQVLSMYSNQKLVSQQDKSKHTEFFIRFINLTKSILQYKKNLVTINSALLDDLNFNNFSNEETLSENLYFMKRCNNSVNTLKSKIKALY